jgi:predicted nucleic acid-binding protein
VILVDTSVWIEHLSRENRQLAAVLDAGEALIHPFVIGEIALGHLGPRETILKALHLLPQAGVASADEVLHLIEQHRLFGLGIGYVDVQLLAAARLMGGVPLWTHDRRLRAAAEKIGLPHGPSE